jgi:predicted methyltransferase
MGCSPLLFSLFLMSPCGQGGSDNASDAASDAMARSQTPDKELEIRSSHKPAEVLSSFNIRPGLSVLELFSDGGYYGDMFEAIRELQANGDEDHT